VAVDAFDVRNVAAVIAHEPRSLALNGVLQRAMGTDSLTATISTRLYCISTCQLLVRGAGSGFEDFAR
ncbi:hypothetical protein BO94DRAFT_462621, partial [Aspergillus sclerotioniger CBS 115572]